MFVTEVRLTLYSSAASSQDSSSAESSQISSCVKARFFLPLFRFPIFREKMTLDHVTEKQGTSSAQREVRSVCLVCTTALGTNSKFY